MGYTQIWEKEGCGTDNATLLKIVKEFRENGVQGLNSCAALTAYVQKLSDLSIEVMLRSDEEATLQILVDTEGAAAAFKRLSCVYAKDYAEKLQLQGWINPKNYAEACEKYEERVGKAQAAADNAESKLFEALRRQEELEEEKEMLKFQIIALKAKLYDAYEAMNEPTDKNNIKGDMQPCRAKTEKTPSGSLE